MNTADIKHWGDSTLFLGTDITHWLLALGAALLAYLVATWALRFALKRLQRMAGRSRTTLDDAAVQVLSGTNRALIAVAALLIGVNLLDLPDRWATRVSQLWFVAVALQLALWGGRAIRI